MADFENICKKGVVRWPLKLQFLWQIMEVSSGSKDTVKNLFTASMTTNKQTNKQTNSKRIMQSKHSSGLRLQESAGLTFFLIPSWYVKWLVASFKVTLNDSSALEIRWAGRGRESSSTATPPLTTQSSRIVQNSARRLRTSLDLSQFSINLESPRQKPAKGVAPHAWGNGLARFSNQKFHEWAN